MQVRQSCSESEFKQMDTAKIRTDFLIESLFEPDQILMTYSHIDRIIVGGAIPKTNALDLDAASELRALYFLQRREMGIINIGGDGYVEADEMKYEIKKYECLYLGRGTKKIVFHSMDSSKPAIFYFNSCPAHANYPNTLMTLDNATPVHLGSDSLCNKRTIYKYIHNEGTRSCQLVMGVTKLEVGSVWNTMPTHTHERRMEVYLYFDLSNDQLVFHMMGAPNETRHVIIKNQQAVISPSWSIHSGVGTRNYSFIWGMCGENQDFADMDPVDVNVMR